MRIPPFSMAVARVALAASALLGSGCSGSSSSSDVCSPGTCGTCCDSSGQCVPAVSPTACPAAGPGSSCQACATGDACYGGAGRCGPANPAFAFVTTATYDGNLARAGGGATGLLGGDNLCQAVAASVGLTGTFKAWLSDASTNAIDRLTDVGGWYTLGAYPNVIFANKAQLATGPSNAFSDEHGNYGFQPTWTGTNADGSRATSDFIQGTSANCGGWTQSFMDSGVTGSNGHLSGLWTNNSAQQCQNKASLYCFQQSF